MVPNNLVSRITVLKVLPHATIGKGVSYISLLYIFNKIGNEMPGLLLFGINHQFASNNLACRVQKRKMYTRWNTDGKSVSSNCTIMRPFKQQSGEQHHEKMAIQTVCQINLSVPMPAP